MNKQGLPLVYLCHKVLQYTFVHPEQVQLDW